MKKFEDFLEFENQAEVYQCYLEHEYIDEPDDDYDEEYPPIINIDVEEAGYLISPETECNHGTFSYKRIIIVEFYCRRFLFSIEARNVVHKWMDSGTKWCYRTLSSVEDCYKAFEEIQETLYAIMELDGMNLDGEEYFLALNKDKFYPSFDDSPDFY